MDPTATPIPIDTATATATAVATATQAPIQIITASGIDPFDYGLWILLAGVVLLAFLIGIVPWFLSGAGRWRR